MRTPLSLVACLVATALALAACSPAGTGTPSPATATADAAGFPLTVTHELGETVVERAPQRIVSTSVVLTGSLLAIGAPVIGSGASMPGAVGMDDQGFFAHWSDAARARGVTALYQNSELDLEAVTLAAPDLIVASASGGDATAEHYDQLAAIAPTVVLNYNSTSWQDITLRLGEITGRTAAARAAIDTYRATLTSLAATFTAPTAGIQLAVYNGENGCSVALPDGPHDLVLQDLGLRSAPVDRTNDINAESNRRDFAFFSRENCVGVLTAPILMLVDGDAATVDALTADAALAGIPARGEGGKVIALGHPSFKLDYYSAIDMAEHVAHGLAG